MLAALRAASFITDKIRLMTNFQWGYDGLGGTGWWWSTPDTILESRTANYGTITSIDMQKFLYDLRIKNCLKTAKCTPKIMKLMKNQNINHLKFLLVTDVIIDGKLTDFVVTGSSNL